MLIEDLLERMKVHPFSLSVNGSNDSDLEKMNPITVRIYDVNCNTAVTRFLDMCTSTSATAEGVYTVMDGKLVKLLNCCPCHIIHNAARKAGESFTECCGFDVEEFTIDLYYWFDKSTKRKNGIRSYCTFCHQEYRAIVKHVSTRWLNLEIAVQGSLKQLPSLTSYFKSENESQGRFKRLQNVLSHPMTEVNLLFFQSVLPSFKHCNQFLQRDEPLIHVLQPVSKDAKEYLWEVC